MHGRVLIALPDRDFDPTEVAVPWDRLRRAGADVVFATEHGETPSCDPKLLSGVIFGKLGARPEHVALYHEAAATEAFRKPRRWADVRVSEYEALVLPGGHAPGMKQYLESTLLQAIALDFVRTKPVGAICHGVVVLARTLERKTGKSVINGRRATALPSALEGAAFLLTFWKLGRYYRTYPEYVQDEVTRALGSPSLFERGPLFASYDQPFHVQDGDLVTARWPGDATAFADALVARIEERQRPPEAAADGEPADASTPSAAASR